MIFTCDYCLRRYSLQDDRIFGTPGEKFVVRCKNCSNPIQLRVPEQPDDGHRWYWLKGDVSIGPLETHSVRKLFRDGEITATDLLRHRDATQGVPLESIEVFASLFPWRVDPRENEPSS